MQTPICTFCAKTSVLCDHCEKNLKEGKISQIDVDLSKYLYEKHTDLELEYVSSFNARDSVVLFFKGDIGRIVGKGGRSVLELSKKFGKRVKIINLNEDIKKVISDIIYPVSLLGINSVFTNDGEISKIRLEKKDLMRIPFDISSLEKILFQLLHKKIRIVFE
jgi:transcription antitermination factor NusA-like protein